MWATHLVGTEPKVCRGPCGTSAAGSSQQSAAKMSAPQPADAHSTFTHVAFKPIRCYTARPRTVHLAGPPGVKPKTHVGNDGAGPRLTLLEKDVRDGGSAEGAGRVRGAVLRQRPQAGFAEDVVAGVAHVRAEVHVQAHGADVAVPLPRRRLLIVTAAVAAGRAPG